MRANFRGELLVGATFIGHEERWTFDSRDWSGYITTGAECCGGLDRGVMMAGYGGGAVGLLALTFDGLIG